jgi:hypothetical protein
MLKLQGEKVDWRLVLLPIAITVVYYGVIRPIAFVLYRLIPAGRVKTFLFRVRWD